jgi:hypothetical protein
MGGTIPKPMPADETLEALLLDLFELNEFKDFLYGLVNGLELVDSLPSSEVSRKQYVSAAVDALQKRGILNKNFFDLLLKKRPGQITRIKEVAQLLNITVTDLDTPELLLDDLESVLAQVTRQIIRISSNKENLDLYGLLEILKLAISLGRPLYNSGNEKKCALIYQHTVQQVIPILSRELDVSKPKRNRLRKTLSSVESSTSPMDEPLFLQRKSSPMGDFGDESQSISGLTDNNIVMTVRSDLSETLGACPQIDVLSADKVSWRLRYSFNRIFNFVKGVQAIDDAINSSKSSSSYETERNISAAISFGMAIYGEASDNVERTRAIQTSASMLSYAAKRINGILSDPFFMRISQEDREYIMSILSDCRVDITADNAYYVAWNVRYGLEELLKLR